MTQADDDFSGADSNRPDYNRLLSDAKEKKFDIVLCKSQSRFTRDLEQLEKYIHNKFVEWGIRFIGLVDNADTSIKGNKKSRQINGLVNEWYLEDSSENVKSILNYQKKQGLFVGAFAPYGYLKDPNNKHQLIVDTNVSNNIKTIFEMYLEKNSLRQIAESLNNKNILTPLRYKQEILKSKFCVASATMPRGVWNDSTVSMILRNQMYVGNMVQGKSEKISYKSKVVKRKNQEDWIIVKGTHEPIISMAIFQEAKALASGKSRPISKVKSAKYSGVLKCALCDGALVRQISRGKHYYRCSFSQRNLNLCKGSSISEESLDENILKELKVNIKRYIKQEEIVKKIVVDFGNNFAEKRNQQAIKELKFKIKEHKIKLYEKELVVLSLYEDKVKKIITEAQFVKMNENFKTELVNLESIIEQHEFHIKNAEKYEEELLKINENEADRENMIKKQLNFKELTRDMILELIEYVIVLSSEDKSKKKMKIYWDF